MRDEYDDVFSVAFADHRRLVAERFRRIWQLVEDIASQPGKSRKELASQFALSERQVQADLNVIRREMNLPLVRKQGYLDETITVDLQSGQNFHYSPILKALGITEDIKTGGKFKKLFGGESTAGMGKVAVKTQPKGAQIMVNNRVLDKTAPFDFYLNPGTYVIDVTMSGYRPLHRVVNIQEGEKLAIEETLVPE